MTHRPLHAIAADIRASWPSPYYGAVPYLDALSTLTSIDESYYDDDAETVVRYLLANLSTFRGEAARSIKAELKAALAEVN